MTKLVRQGDLLFQRINEIDLGRNGKSSRRTILMRGESTGHAHRITEGEVVVLDRFGWRGEEGPPLNTYLDVQQAATVTHEEHAPVTLLPGLYEMIQAREFDYVGGIERRVRD